MKSNTIQAGQSLVLSTDRSDLVAGQCRYYGKNGMMFGRLVSSGGNECGLITESYSPCQMEMAGAKPDETVCPLIPDLKVEEDHPELKPGEAKCEMCNHTFTCGWSDEQALAEERAVVCDDCYQIIRPPQAARN